MKHKYLIFKSDNKNKGTNHKLKADDKSNGGNRKSKFYKSIKINKGLKPIMSIRDTEERTSQALILSFLFLVANLPYLL